MRLAILFGLTLAAACTTATKYRTPGAPVLPVYHGAVTVYEHPDSVPPAVVRLGTIEAGGTAWNTRRGVLEHLEREARELGANAILLEGYDTQGLGEVFITGSGDEFRKARAVALLVPSDTSAALDGPSPPP
jgi:hypothetical protein